MNRIAASAVDAASPRVNFAAVAADCFRFATPKTPNIPANPKMKTESTAIRESGNWLIGPLALRNVLALPPVPVIFACVAALIAWVWMVSIVDAGPLVALRLCGLNAHVAPAGRPEQLKVTGCLNPFSGVTVNVIDPVAPAATVRLELLMESEKSAAGAAVTVTVVVAEVEAL